MEYQAPEVDALVRHFKGLPGVVKLLFIAGGDDILSKELEAFSERLVGGSGGRIIRASDDGSHRQSIVPCLSLAGAHGPNIHYHALPAGHEVAPFKEILRNLAIFSMGDISSSDISAHETGELLIFISPSCPNCPRVVNSLSSLVMEHPWIDLHIIDATRFSDLAERYCIKSVPAIFVNREILMVGPVEKEKVVSLIVHPHSIEYSQERLRSLIQTGQALRAGKALADDQKPQILIPVFQKATFDERIGILLAMEEALSFDPRCLDNTVEDLIGVLLSGDRGLRGDTAYILGKISHTSAFGALEALLNDPDPEIVEVAEEAIENIVHNKM